MLAFVLVPLVVGCSGARQLEIFGQSMGTTYVVKVVAAPAALGGDALRARVESLHLAPSYGRGEAERVVGSTFNGKLPQGVRVTTKFQLGNPTPLC
ncbi:MAG: hypothetical protein P8Y95_12790 [Gammaproteobacteria bacterium]